MIDHSPWLRATGLVVVGCPVLLTIALGLSSLFGWKLPERRTSTLVFIVVTTGLLASLAILAWMLLTGVRRVPLTVGNWVVIPHFRFSIKFAFDRLSVPMAILSFVLTGTVGAFAAKYMHRERGYNRFFVLYAIFAMGMVITSLAATIETLFTGWELVGLSSALLIAFFQERQSPSRNGLWVWIVYRLSDAALLLAAVALHHLHSGGEFLDLLEIGSWPEGNLTFSASQAFLVGMLVLLAAMGKSALVPFSGWLPRAMEGPTPSSAVFYGALSVHLGAFLLLRMGPLLERSTWLCAVVVGVGLTTAVYAHAAGSVQADIKSALSFASLSQVGVIVAEIGLGFRYLPLVHLISHACLRTLQFIRAPSLLHDYRLIEDAIGGSLPRPGSPRAHFGGSRGWVYLYRLGLERGYLDAFLRDQVVWNYLRAFRWCDSLERRWTDWLAGGASREFDRIGPQAGAIDELT